MPKTLSGHYKSISDYIPVMLVTNIFILRGIDFGLKTLAITFEKVDAVVAIKDDFCSEFARKIR